MSHKPRDRDLDARAGDAPPATPETPSTPAHPVSRPALQGHVADRHVDRRTGGRTGGQKFR